ncbi:MAG: leucine-rich repeat domain-containing protein [Bacteroidales bacterium]|nr:leucine-rich repeat domain-containing protein [Bacteroidales bacterium]
MKNNWLKFEHEDDKNIMKECDKTATGTIVVPEEVTAIDRYAFTNCTNIESIQVPHYIPNLLQMSFEGCDKLHSLVVNGVEFVRLDTNDPSYISVDDMNSYISKRFFYSMFEPHEDIDKVEDADEAFMVIMKNFMLRKDNILNILCGDRLCHFISIENSYYYLDKFIGWHYPELSDQNKKIAKDFLEHFSDSNISGPAYAKLLLMNDITCGDRDKDMAVAAKQLLSQVYNQETPRTDFSGSSAFYLSQMFKNGYFKEIPEEERNILAGIVIHRNNGSEAFRYRQYIDELNVDFDELMKNGLRKYSKQSWLNAKYKVGDNKYPNVPTQHILSDAAKDVIESISSPTELEQQFFDNSFMAYFARPDCPVLPEIDFGKLMKADYDSSKEESDTIDDVDYYTQTLEDIIEAASYSVYFHPNPKYGNKYAYIAYSDVMGRRYRLRSCKPEDVSSYRDEMSDEVLVTYNSARELFLDGWRMD